MTLTAASLVRHLGLSQHPEGGYYKETYRSAGEIPASALPGIAGNRQYATAIYYLLEKGDFSAFHRIQSDEGWHFYAGGTLLVHVLSESGDYSCVKLGARLEEGETFQFVVPARAWFASELAPGTEFCLAGCTVSPGFDFADFELAGRAALIAQYPQHADIIGRLTR
ncbi:MAG TPA: cupin domain-containing protein [Flavisolibacter sp.]|nr:cupin domain-containing protein [Flavisolibacter sp.]